MLPPLQPTGSSACGRSRWIRLVDAILTAVEVRAQGALGTLQFEFTDREICCDADRDVLYEARAPSQVNYAA
jgi:hypothetical protein